MEPDDKTITITSMNGTTDTITIDLNNTYGATTTTLTVGDIWIDTSTMDLNAYTDSNSWTTIERVMFEDDMPDPQELKRMCEEYPGLEKVYENFKTVYKMVEQDWRGKQDSDENTLF